jgi:hypothetical protein
MPIQKETEFPLDDGVFFLKGLLTSGAEGCCNRLVNQEGPVQSGSGREDEGESHVAGGGKEEWTALGCLERRRLAAVDMSWDHRSVWLWCVRCEVLNFFD